MESKSQTILHEAAKDGDVSLARNALDLGNSINQQDENGGKLKIESQTIPHKAAKDGDVSHVRNALDLGLSINQQDEDGGKLKLESQTIPAKDDDVSLVRNALDLGLSINQQDEDGGKLKLESQTILHKAAKVGDVSHVRYALDLGLSINQQDEDGLTPLSHACLYCHIAVVELLLANDADTNIPHTQGFFPVHLAAQEGSLDIVQLLQKHGANLNCRNEFGVSPLQHASSNGHLSVVKFLHENGAEMQVRSNNGHTPLIAASLHDHLSVVNWLVQNGAQVNEADNRGFSALHCASQNGHVSLADTLIKQGAKLDAKNNEGMTPFLMASKNGHIEVMTKLMQAGAKLNVSDNEGNTALVKACLSEHLRVAEWLIQEGANINTVTNKGFSALHIATKTGSLEIVKFLLSKGAKMDLVNSYGATPFMIACYHGNVDITEYLLRNGAKPDIKAPYVGTAIEIAKKKDHSAIVKQIEYHTRKRTPKKSEEPKSTPPVEINHKEAQNAKPLSKGVENGITGKEWTVREKAHLAKTNCLRVLFIGDFMMGKSSLSKTIEQEGQFTTNESDRTIIATFLHWRPKGRQNKTITLVDLGGHRSYKASGHFFHSNSPNNVAVFCHDIVSDNFEGTFEWVQSVLTRSPKCQVMIVLTKIDQLSKDEVEKRVSIFTKAMVKLFKQELQLLKHSKTVGNAQNFPETDRFAWLQEKYNWLINNIEEFTFTASCLEGYQESVDSVKQRLLELSDRVENQVVMPKPYHEFYKRLGKLGLDVPQMNADESQDESIIGDTKPPAIAPKTMLYRLVNFIPGTKKREKKPDEKNLPKVNVPLQSVHTQYVSLTEAIHVYKEILSELNLPLDNLEKQTMECLDCFHKHGLVIYFTGNNDLEQVIFNDIGTFVNVLRCVFNHNVARFLQYDEDDLDMIYRHFGMYNTEEEFNDSVNLLQNHGLLSTPLLSILLDKSNCAIEANTVIQLLNKLEVGFPFTPQGAATQHTFIPFFLEKQTVPPGIEGEIERACETSSDMLSLKFSIRGNLVLTFWHYLLVRLYKLIHQDRATQKRKVWDRGFWATLGRCDAQIFLVYPRKDEVTFIVQASIKTVEGHRLLWEYIKYISEECDHLMTEWWPGMVTNKLLHCTHCLLPHPNKANEPKKWNVDQLLIDSQIQNPVETCFCSQEPEVSFPSALIMPLPKDDEKASMGLQQLTDYLHERGLKPTMIKQDMDLQDKIETQFMDLAKEITEVKDQVTEMTDQVSELQEQRDEREAPLQACNITQPRLVAMYNDLVENIKPGDIIPSLVSKGVITLENMQIIDNEVTTNNKVKRILYAVDQMGPEGLAHLVSSLNQTLQQHIANKLKPAIKDKSSALRKLKGLADTDISSKNEESMIPGTFTDTDTEHRPCHQQMKLQLSAGKRMGKRMQVFMTTWASEQSLNKERDDEQTSPDLSPETILEDTKIFQI